MTGPPQYPQPPSFLLDLYGLSGSASSDTHPSIFYDDRDEHTFPTPTSSSTLRPYVTLTFAQSLDAKIAGAGGTQLILSGQESLVMTHWMRTLHDAILVGIGTALNDDPQLNTRHLPALSPDCPHAYRLPRPVILDTHLRLAPTCKLLKNYQAGRGCRPWVVCAPHVASRDAGGLETFSQRAVTLQSAGARIIEVDADESTGLVSIRGVLAALRGLGVRSLMVEGGARVIRSFLSFTANSPEASGSREGSDASGNGKIVDALVVTVAPVLVGEAGVGYGAGEILPTFEHVRTEVFGPDAVVALRVL